MKIQTFLRCHVEHARSIHPSRFLASPNHPESKKDRGDTTTRINNKMEDKSSGSSSSHRGNGLRNDDNDGTICTVCKLTKTHATVFRPLCNAKAWSQRNCPPKARVFLQRRHAVQQKPIKCQPATADHTHTRQFSSPGF